MPFPFETASDAETDRQPFGAPEDEDLRAMLRPIMAGARARGVADGLEMLGVGAVLIDATGLVLHVGGRGRRMMGGRLRIVEDHLVAARPSDNRMVEDLISGAISCGGSSAVVRLEWPDGALSLRAIAFPTDEGAAQRLHAVLLLEESHADEKAFASGHFASA